MEEIIKQLTRWILASQQNKTEPLRDRMAAKLPLKVVRLLLRSTCTTDDLSYNGSR